MGRVKEELFDAERAAWESSPEGRAEQEKAVQEREAADAERERREKVCSLRHPDEWAEWARISLLLIVPIDFADPRPFEFTDFLMEVGRRPSPNHAVVRVDETRSYQPGNLVWAAKTPEPPKSPYLNADEAAAFLGVSKRTLYNNRPHIPALSGFRTLMFDPKVLDQVRASARFKSQRRKPRSTS